MRGTCKRVGVIFVLSFVFGVLNCEHKEFQNRYDPDNLPPAPELLFPDSGEVCTQNPPYFEWIIQEDTLNPLYGEPLKYELQIDNDQDLSSPEYTATIYDTLSFLPFIDMPDGVQYWRIRAQYENGGWSQWSNTFSFSARFPLISTYNTSAYDICVNQNKAFCASEERLKILDISNPYAPTLLCDYRDTIAGFHNIIVEDNYVYSTGHYSDAFSIYSVQDPANPLLVSRLDVGPPMNFCLSNGKAYVCRAGLPLVIDVSNPESIAIIDSLPVYGWDVAVRNNIAYVVYNELYVVDLSNNSIIATLNGGHLLWLLANYLYISDFNNDVCHIYDITDPYNPMLASTISVICRYICSASNLLFIESYAEGYTLVRIYDTTDKTNPVEAGSVFHLGGQLYADETFLYAGSPRFSIIKHE